MKNLTIHRLALGVLMAFVLAFGVQSVVEAQTVAVSGDTAVKGSATGTAVISVADISSTNTLERSFTLRVTNAKDTDDVALTPTNATVTQIKVTSAPSDPASDPDDTDDPDPTPAKDAIVSGNTITFGGLGNKNDNAAGTSGAPNTASWTFKVTYTVAQLGLYSIDADHNDPSPDIEAYVVRSKGKAASYELDKATAADITQTPQESGTNIVVQVVEGTTDQPWVQVDVSISGGKLYPKGQFLSGSRLYALNDANDNGYTSLSVFTDSEGKIDVTVRPNINQTATVTAKISGTSGDHASHTVTYFDNPVTIERVSGNYQHARPGASLPQPLVVRVLDGSRKIKDQRVRFTGSTGSRLYATSSSDLITESGSAEGTAVLSVKTNSSGEAKVYLRVPEAAAGGVVTVNAVVAGTPPPPGSTLDSSETFTVFAVRRQTGTSTITASTPTPLESSDPNYNRIYLTTSTATTEVEFTITGGQLYLKPELLDLDGLSLGQRDDKPKYVSNLKISSDAGSLIGTADAPILFARVTSGIATVTARIPGSSEDTAVKVIQIIAGNLDLQTVSGGTPTTGGVPGGFRKAPFVVRALAGGSPISGQIVKFTTSEGNLAPVPGTRVFLTSLSSDRLAAADGSNSLLPGTNIVGTILREEQYKNSEGNAIAQATPIFVETDDQGEAKVYLKMGGTAGTSHIVTAQLPVGNESVTFTVTSEAGDIAARLQKIEVPDKHSDDQDRQTLAVRVRNLNDDPLPNVNIRWTTTDDGTISHRPGHGMLTNNDNEDDGENPPGPPTGAVSSGEEIFVRTDAYGEVWVTYLKDEDKSKQSVRAEVASEQGTQDYDFEIGYVTFDIGTGTSGTTDPTNPYLRLSVSPSSGAAGATGTLTVTAYGSTGSAVSGIPVTLSATGVTLPSSVTSGQSTSFTFPNSSTTVSARATGYTSTSTQITVTQPTTGTSDDTTGNQVASTLAIVSGNSQVVKTNQTLDPFVVEVKDQKGKAVSGVEVLFQTGGAGTLSSSKATTGSNGQATTTLSLPTTQRDFVTYTVYATVIGVEGLKQQFTVIARKPVLSRLQARSGNLQTGFVGERLAEPLEVQVLDTDDDPVSGVQVTFTVLSEESTGTATPLTQSDQSDTGGYAGARITPTGAGAIQIQASVEDLTPVQISFTATLPPSQLVKVSGNDQNAGPGKKLSDPFVVEVQDANGSPVAGIPVSFKVTAGGGQISARSAVTDTYGRAQTTLTLGKDRGQNTVEASVTGMPLSTTFGAISGAQVHVGAAQRPSLYWVDTKAGTLQRLVGDRVESIAPNIRNATHVVVDTDGGKIYWAAQTAKNAGRIWRANLNGTNTEKIRDLAVSPMGLALDAAGGRLYWTNPRGRIQSMSTSGGKITNIRENLPKPTAIALSNGVLYWGQAGGSVRRMNLTGNQKVVSNIAKGGEPLDIAIGKGKVYWTEKTAEKAGRIRRANLDGSNVQNVKVLSSIPIGIVVDAADKKIYWTNSRARIQRSNLVGGKIQNVVTDLVSPGILTLGGGEIVEPPPVVKQPTQQTQPTTQPTTYSKYDINKDGAVNNKDTRLVAAAIGQSGSAITNARADVDGSGTVDVTDLILVIGNLDDDAAAPMLDLDVKAMDLDFDRVQEQVEALLASGDRSIAAQRALLYLQHLLASARPDETVLLANYPNPFNPETWIPYHLAESTDVAVRIYDAQGVLVRVLTLGHQTAGYYTSRSRAAYWDGRNALGERVASGIYFYQLQTDAISPMRKMVILK